VLKLSRGVIQRTKGSCTSATADLPLRRTLERYGEGLLPGCRFGAASTASHLSIVRHCRPSWLVLYAAVVAYTYFAMPHQPQASFGLWTPAEPPAVTNHLIPTRCITTARTQQGGCREVVVRLRTAGVQPPLAAARMHRTTVSNTPHCKANEAAAQTIASATSCDDVSGHQQTKYCKHTSSKANLRTRMFWHEVPYYISS
jgi:hypothetical protein